jgi:hypothetical protein
MRNKCKETSKNSSVGKTLQKFSIYRIDQLDRDFLQKKVKLTFCKSLNLIEIIAHKNI